MIRYLHRARARKGFTIVELIVVLAIIGVLMAVILPSISRQRSLKEEANATARDFYTALQTTMTKYSLYEGPLSPDFAEDPDLGDMRYYPAMGGNYPYKRGTVATDTPATTSLYIEVITKNGQITAILTNTIVGTQIGFADGQGLYELCQRLPIMEDTKFGVLLKNELQTRMSYQDGYYYARVTYENKLTSTIPAKMEASTVKVNWTGFGRERLPVASGGLSTFKDDAVRFGDDNTLVSGEKFGTCAAWNAATGTYIGLGGTTLN